MLPDNFPVFQIELDCDFESSDNVYPTLNRVAKKPSKATEHTVIVQNETSAIFSTIGERRDNLDRCVVVKENEFTIMAVFDGHCDPQPVEYLENELPKKLRRHSQVISHPEEALRQVFQECERQVIEKFQKGSTALVVLLSKKQLFVANLGDSKLIGVDSCGNTKDYTSCHNLNNPAELKSVISRGGLVLKRGSQYRINGQLNLSRCFGDKHLKDFVSSIPEICRYNLSDCKRWVLATDGFYNAQNLDYRLKINNVNDLGTMGTVYKDNASAIFFDA